MASKKDRRPSAPALTKSGNRSKSHERRPTRSWAIPGWAWSLPILTLLALYVYHPALNRVFTADQVNYMVELGGDDSLSAGLAHYDYAASRRFEKGDEVSFRPLLFVWLAVCNALFSYHHAWWNWATLALHILVAFQLYRLLNEICSSPLALGFASLFVALKPAIELPVWSHLGGYMLAWLFFAVAAQGFVRMTVKKHADFRTLLVYSVSLTAACLCHEAMIPITVLGGVIVLAADWADARRFHSAKALAAFAPVVIFAVLYGFHMERVERLAYVERPDKSGLLESSRVAAALEVIPTALGRWVAEMAVPSALSIYAPPFSRLRKALLFSSRASAHLFNLILAVVLVWLILSTTSRARCRRVWPILLFLGGAILIYVSAVSFVRAPHEVVGTTYYVYFFCLLSLSLLYSLGDFSDLEGPKVPVAMIVMSVFVLSHAFQTAMVTEEIGQNNAPSSTYYTELSRFADRHRREEAFTFAVEASPANLDPIYSVREGYPDNSKGIHSWSGSEIFFKKYYDAEKPKYVVWWDGSKIRERREAP